MVAQRVNLFALANLLVIVALYANEVAVTAGLPTVNTDSPPKPQGITGKLENGVQSKEGIETGALVAQTAAPATLLVASPAAQQVSPSAAAGKVHIVTTKEKSTQANNAEKVKRGLSNFMNHLNPATYFVPPKTSSKASSKPAIKPAPPAGSQAEPATIVNDGSTAGDVLMKGPNRLVQARQLGGPLRWGRR